MTPIATDILNALCAPLSIERLQLIESLIMVTPERFTDDEVLTLLDIAARHDDPIVGAAIARALVLNRHGQCPLG